MNKLNKLLETMETLRDPINGCPWDNKQSEQTLKEYIIEEAYELVEAIDLKSTGNILEELGDLLLQIVFISQINREKGNFTFDEVIENLNKKLIRRHPHIFGDIKVSNAEEVKNNWEKIKKKEKSKKSILSSYPSRMPSLLVAKRISEQAASIGFDWNSPEDAIKKVEEEIEELKIEIRANNLQNIDEELGDLLFAISNVSRKLHINPEISLRQANKKFSERFKKLENYFEKKEISLSKTTLEEMTGIWDKIKEEEKKN